MDAVFAEITVNSISSLQKAINDGYKSIKLSSAIYSTSNQIVISNIENLVIIGETIFVIVPCLLFTFIAINPRFNYF